MYRNCAFFNQRIYDQGLNVLSASTRLHKEGLTMFPLCSAQATLVTEAKNRSVIKLWFTRAMEATEPEAQSEERSSVNRRDGKQNGSGWSRNGVRRKTKPSDPSDSNSVTLPIALPTLFFWLTHDHKAPSTSDFDSASIVSIKPALRGWVFIVNVLTVLIFNYFKGLLNYRVV